jgi:hypothetical protein
VQKALALLFHPWLISASPLPSSINAATEALATKQKNG